MSDIFNNRELAVGIWTLLLIVWGLSKSEIRRGFLTVIGALLQRKILTILCLFITYVVFSVYVLLSLNIWDTSQVKSTMIWSVFVGAASLFGITNIKRGDNYFSSSFKQQFKVIVLIEFVVAFCTFGLITELFLVPVSTLLICVSVYAEYHPEHRRAKVIADRILSIFGITLLLYSLFVTISNANKFIQLSTFQDFVTPILLTTLLLPFLYVLSKLIAYESAYVQVYMYTNLPARRRYAILASLAAFKGDVEAIDNWLKYSCIPEFESNKSIKESIIKYKDKKLSEQTV